MLTDIRMPGIGGIEVLKAAHELDPNIPVILMTAQASLQSAIQAVNQGAFHYIQKPFSNDELLGHLPTRGRVAAAEAREPGAQEGDPSQGRYRGKPSCRAAVRTSWRW